MNTTSSPQPAATAAAPASAARSALLKQLFPQGIPELWCPSLTHYSKDGRIDPARIAAHLRHLSTHVKGFLIPGSTGDGWQLTDQEFWTLLDIAIEQCQRLDLRLLVGILKSDAASALTTLHDVNSWLKRKTGETDTLAACNKARVSGFTVCAPHGKDLPQKAIRDGLTALLKTQLPLALYQLPQVTKNEIAPETAIALAEQFENFLLFKDSSWADRIVLADRQLGGVFTMRGAEGDYSKWVKSNGGPYDGFLLSTANCFAAELQQMLASLRAGEPDAASLLSRRLTTVVDEMFALASPLPSGNPFSNANKAIDHFFAFGPGASHVAPPCIHGGIQLPGDFINATGQVLSRHGFLPRRGYIE